MKLRIVRSRGKIDVHAFDCTEIGRGREEAIEAQNAIGTVEALAAKVASIRFASCVDFAAPEDESAPIPRVPPRASLDVKVDMISTWAEEHGWEVDDQGQTVILTREAGEEGPELIRLVFNAKSYDSRASRYVFRGIADPLITLDVVMARLAGKPGEAVSAAKRRTRKSLPFNPDAAEDIEVLDAVYGRTIVWNNTLTGGEESGHVPAPQKGVKSQTRLHASSTGRRMLTFCDGGRNFRTVALDSLVAVK
jgi:hypothetical protein